MSNQFLLSLGKNRGFFSTQTRNVNYGSSPHLSNDVRLPRDTTHKLIFSETAFFEMEKSISAELEALFPSRERMVGGKYPDSLPFHVPTRHFPPSHLHKSTAPMSKLITSQQHRRADNLGGLGAHRYGALCQTEWMFGPDRLFRALIVQELAPFSSRCRLRKWVKYSCVPWSVDGACCGGEANSPLGIWPARALPCCETRQLQDIYFTLYACVRVYDYFVVGQINLKFWGAEPEMT